VGAAAGVMITASHNPKWDNGYKVYWANGAQILSPHDKHIQAAILANLMPEPGAFAEPPADHPLLSNPLAKVNDDYFSVVAANVWDRTAVAAMRLPIVYTAMHGVGYPYVRQAWQRAGFGEDTLGTYRYPVLRIRYVYPGSDHFLVSQIRIRPLLSRIRILQIREGKN
jgi:phosphomannomutase